MSSQKSPWILAVIFAGIIIVLTAVILNTGCTGSAQQADLVILNAKVVTLEESQPSTEALAVRGGRIMALGTNDDIRVHIGDGTTVLDLGGNLV